MTAKITPEKYKGYKIASESTKHYRQESPLLPASDRDASLLLFYSASPHTGLLNICPSTQYHCGLLNIHRSNYANDTELCIYQTLVLSMWICGRQVDPINNWYKKPECFSSEIPEMAARCLLVPLSLEWWSTIMDQPGFTVSPPIQPTHLGSETIHQQTRPFTSMSTHQSQLPDHMWHSPPGCPPNKWLDQLRDDSNLETFGGVAVNPWRYWCNDATALTG